MVLLHGLFSSAEVNWIKFGHAQTLADAGFEAIMPDLRAHGESAAPHDPAAYPPDVLVRDAVALVAASRADRLRPRRLLARRAHRCAVRAGGHGAAQAGARRDGARRARRLGRSAPRSSSMRSTRFDEVKQGDPAYLRRPVHEDDEDRPGRGAAAARIDRRHRRARSLSGIAMPTLVLCGDEDRDNGSPEAWATALPQRAAPVRCPAPIWAR